MEAMSGSFSFSETKSESSNVNLPLWPLSWFVSYKEEKSSKSFNSRSSNYEKEKRFLTEKQGEYYISRSDCIGKGSKKSDIYHFIGGGVSEGQLSLSIFFCS